MEPVKRAVRLPADNCPECMSESTIFVMASFREPEQGSLVSPSMQVSYRCRVCSNSWITAWAVERVA